MIIDLLLIIAYIWGGCALWALGVVAYDKWWHRNHERKWRYIRAHLSEFVNQDGSPIEL